MLLARFALGAVSTTVSQLYIAVKARELVVPPWLWWGAPLGGIVGERVLRPALVGVAKGGPKATATGSSEAADGAPAAIVVLTALAVNLRLAATIDSGLRAIPSPSRLTLSGGDAQRVTLRL